MSKTFGDLVGTDESLDVLVGTGSTDSTHELPQKFTLRCGSFLPRSEFLRKARRKMWNESLKCWSEEPIMMADDRPSTFEEYARHVYFGTIFDSPEYEDSLDYKRIVQSHFSRMIRLYLLAEKRCDLKTSNLMLDEIYLYSQSGSYLPGRDVINEAYEATDTDHEWWTPQSLQCALNGVEYAILAATDGTIERTWHPATSGHLDDVGQQGFDWGFHDWAAKAWHGGFADEAEARTAHDAHFARR